LRYPVGDPRFGNSKWAQSKLHFCGNPVESPSVMNTHKDQAELIKLKKEAAQFAGRWVVIGTDIWTAEHKFMMSCQNKSLAQYVARAHNLLLTLLNILLAQGKKLSDRSVVTKSIMEIVENVRK
jgi:hypothetical protein